MGVGGVFLPGCYLLSPTCSMYVFRRENGTVFNGFLPKVQKLTLADD